jgi:hypothetical protein
MQQKKAVKQHHKRIQTKETRKRMKREKRKSEQLRKNKKEFFEILDKLLDDDVYRNQMELKAIERAKELSTNEDTMIKELHKQLSN